MEFLSPPNLPEKGTALRVLKFQKEMDHLLSQRVIFLG
jgi:hypothetical protein